jgi:ElaB/YqjD/DUF883 family membrane-anchored ribosome-binding protein
MEKFLDDLKTVVRDSEQLLKVSATEAKRRAIAGLKTTDRTVREYPYQTLGVAFGLGILAGALVSGLCSRSELQELED